MGGKADRYFLPALVGFAPVVLALLTWRAGPRQGLQFLTLLDALPVLAAELVVITVALREGLVRWLRAEPPPGVAGIALAAWLAIAVGTALFVAPAPGAAIRWTLHYAVHLLFGFSVAFLCGRGLRVGDFVACFLAGFVAFAAVFLAFVAGHWGQSIDWVHDLPGAIHVRHAGIYAAAMTGVSIGAMAAARERLGWVLAFACATVGFALGLWTGSRGMALSVVGATIAAMIVIPQMRSPKVWGAAALALGVGIAAVASLPVPNETMMGVARTVAATTEREATTGRIDMWLQVVQAIAKHPVFGYGSGQMPLVAQFSNMGQPHNVVLQLLLDWGLAGFACMLILGFYYVRRAWPELRNEGAALAAPFMGAMSILLLSMLDAALFHVLPVAIFAACAGMLAARTPSGEPKPRRS